jgi:hypothetical protein
LRQVDLNLESIEDLWTLHEEVNPILVAKLGTEKLKLEKRIEQLQGDTLDSAKQRRPSKGQSKISKSRSTRSNVVRSRSAAALDPQIPC